ncbi:hypothetical protein [Prevotella sp. kh1p2]|uniref:hypothetical protein n=1 Tax=Prevotella sp. kh1p2 TaxID=1761883 RepID=UPI0008B1A89A|nr:hypothetical protein [Prevotella sp. kh1p2]SES63239.1 hypothetical protein SAMN04487825_101102 [Prevotella sp. kh1p2]SNU10152.1 hypothetical protein SAMN06298210_101184 [Prevotellaceae bacterium KH2P17]
MKITTSLIQRLILLAEGKALPTSSLRGEWFRQMQTDGILLTNIHGSHQSLRAADTSALRHYLASHYDIRNLEATLHLLQHPLADRALQVQVTGNSKFVRHRTFRGFLVNSYQSIAATLNGTPLTILPTDGSFVFIADSQNFSIPPDVMIVGVENAENFRYVKRQRYLFESCLPQGCQLLFVSRYPQQQHADLINWLLSIPNQYIHFGDLDLAGIAIFQHEFYEHLGMRSTFLIPEDYEERIREGNRERYDAQLPQYAKMSVTDSRISSLLTCIHHYHRGYDQEGFIL